jgi:esterase/lipase
MVSLAEKQDLDKLYKRIVQEYDGKIKLLVPIETLNKKTEEQDNTLKNRLAEYAHKNDVATLKKQINETVSKFGRIKKTAFVLAAFILSQWIVILLILAGVIN